MKRLTLLLCLCAGLALVLTDDANARKKKRKKGEPVICKKGKLIFEDDFSGKEFSWINPDADKAEWRIVKKMLAVGLNTDWTGRNRPFTPVGDVLAQMRIQPPAGVAHELWVRFLGGRFPGLCLSPSRQVAQISMMGGGGGQREQLATMPFPYPKRRWCNIIIEARQELFAVTIDGKTMEATYSDQSNHTKTGLLVCVNPDDPVDGLLLIDDVRVYEALPLDAPDYKEEKTADAKDEKPDEDEPAKAEKPKEEKPAVELSNALGKDTEGNPISWDLSAKGIMRSADDQGKLSKVTLYGPGEMTARVKAQTLVIRGKGELSIKAGGKTQTVSLPGEAKINGGGFITLKAKKGTVQITDITAEGKP